MRRRQSLTQDTQIGVFTGKRGVSELDLRIRHQDTKTSINHMSKDGSQLIILGYSAGGRLQQCLGRFTVAMYMWWPLSRTWLKAMCDFWRCFRSWQLKKGEERYHNQLHRSHTNRFGSKVQITAMGDYDSLRCRALVHYWWNGYVRIRGRAY